MPMKPETEIDAHQAAPEHKRVPLLHNRDFLKLWSGETVSDFGSRMGAVAISFAAVISLHATPFQMGLLSAAQIVPALAFGLFAGVWVDRLRRRPLMIAADLGRFALLATVPIAAITGRLGMPQLYAVIVLAAILDITFDVAYRSYLPTLVGRADIVDANSKLATTSAVAEMAGFGLSGWLVQWLTAPFAIAVDAISFLPSAIAIAAIRTPEPSVKRDRAREDVLREIRDGARFVLGDSRLRALAAAAIAGASSYSVFSAAFMLFVVNTLGFKPDLLGMIFAVGGVSSFFGALIAARAAERFGAGRAMAVGFAMEGAALMLVPIARGADFAAAALLVAQQIIGDLAGTVFQINAVSLRQSLAPDQILGRVNASISFVARAAAMAGAVGGGWLGGAIGLRATLALGAAGLFVAAAMLAMSAVWSLDGAGSPIEPLVREAE
jgi:predicted MFS family arabinose efflux permease